MFQTIQAFLTNEIRLQCHTAERKRQRKCISTIYSTFRQIDTFALLETKPKHKIISQR